MFSKIKYFIQQSWLLLFTSFLFGLMIAVADAAWSVKVEQNKIAKMNNLMKGLISDANTFEVAIKDANIPGDKGQIVKTNVYKALDEKGNNIGFVFVAVGGGFGDKIELVIAVDANCGRFLGFQVLSANETPGFGDRIKNDSFRNQFRGAPAEQFSLIKIGRLENIDSEIVAISGATVTSTAVVNIFNKSIVSIKEQLYQKGLIK